MPQRNTEAEARENFDRLVANNYPGRLIVQGLSDTAQFALQVYALTGRSAGSKNRVFFNQVDPNSPIGAPRIRADYPKGYVPPEGTNTAETVYNAMREFGNSHVVSNGKQTDTIIRGFEVGESFEEALLTETFESPESDYTPRISGVIDLSRAMPKAQLSLIHRDPETGEPLRPVTDQVLMPGFGQTLHTYFGDGKPLPTFDTEPYTVPLHGDIDEILATYKAALPADKFAAIAVKSIDLETKDVDFRVFNALPDVYEGEK